MRIRSVSSASSSPATNELRKLQSLGVRLVKLQSLVVRLVKLHSKACNL